MRSGSWVITEDPFWWPLITDAIVPFAAIVAAVFIGQWQVRRTIKVQTDQIANAQRVEAVKIYSRILGRYADFVYMNTDRERVMHARGMTDDLAVLGVMMGHGEGDVFHWFEREIQTLKEFIESDRATWSTDGPDHYLYRVGETAQGIADWASGEKAPEWFTEQLRNPRRPVEPGPAG